MLKYHKSKLTDVKKNYYILLLLYIFIHSKHGMSTISNAIQRIYILCHYKKLLKRTDIKMIYN